MVRGFGSMAAIAGIVGLAVSSGAFAQVIWDSGAPHQIKNNNVQQFVGFGSGHTSATQPQRWVAMPFTVGAGGTVIRTVQADYIDGVGSTPANIRFNIFDRTGLLAPNAPTSTIVQSGILGPNTVGVDDPRTTGTDNYFHQFTNLNIPLAAGDYWFSIYGEGIGAGNTTGFSNITWLTGADLVPAALERPGVWRSAAYPTPGFVEGALAQLQPVAGQDPNDVYQMSYALLAHNIPAPGTAALMLLGMGLLGRRRR